MLYICPVRWIMGWKDTNEAVAIVVDDFFRKEEIEERYRDAKTVDLFKRVRGILSDIGMLSLVGDDAILSEVFDILHSGNTFDDDGNPVDTLPENQIIREVMMFRGLSIMEPHPSILSRPVEEILAVALVVSAFRGITSGRLTVMKMDPFDFETIRMAIMYGEVWDKSSFDRLSKFLSSDSGKIADTMIQEPQGA
jgi:hypothetical protein